MFTAKLSFSAADASALLPALIAVNPIAHCHPSNPQKNSNFVEDGIFNFDQLLRQ